VTIIKFARLNELESIAIENAIHEFGGNLTEAAKKLWNSAAPPFIVK